MRSNAIALLALFLALSGGAYAVTHAPKNSVVSSSIKNGEVESQDLSSKAIAGKIFKVKANSASSTASEPCHRGKTGVFCGYDDGGSSDGQIINAGGALARAAYSKDSAGVVRISGTPAVNSYQTTNELFILPKGMRPKKTHVYEAPCGQAELTTTCFVSVSANGHLTASYTTTPFAGIALDAIAFDTR